MKFTEIDISTAMLPIELIGKVLFVNIIIEALEEEKLEIQVHIW